jgi:hypothetical protein
MIEPIIPGLEYVAADILERQVIKLLETPVWYPSLDSMKIYERYEDMSPDGKLTIIIDEDGDTLISSTKEQFHINLEFCTPMIGGGQSARVHMALRMLALAIKLDNEERKQYRG